MNEYPIDITIRFLPVVSVNDGPATVLENSGAHYGRLVFNSKVNFDGLDSLRRSVKNESRGLEMDLSRAVRELNGKLADFDELFDSLLDLSEVRSHFNL